MSLRSLVSAWVTVTLLGSAFGVAAHAEQIPAGTMEFTVTGGYSIAPPTVLQFFYDTSYDQTFLYPMWDGVPYNAFQVQPGLPIDVIPPSGTWCAVAGGVKHGSGCGPQGVFEISFSGFMNFPGFNPWSEHDFTVPYAFSEGTYTFTPAGNEVPEPASAPLLGLGFAGAVLASCRRKSQGLGRLTHRPIAGV